MNSTRKAMPMVRSGNPLGMSSMAMSAEAVVADKVGRCREKICKKQHDQPYVIPRPHCPALTSSSLAALGPISLWYALEQW